MKIRFRLLSISSLLALLLFASSPIFATSVRLDIGASGKGVQNPDCAANIQTNPACFEFSVVSSSQAMWEAFSLTDFTTKTFSTLGPFDLFLVNGITDGTQVTLTLTGSNDHFGSFFCTADDSLDSNDAAIISAGFCSDPTNALHSDASGIFSLPLPDGSTSTQTFTFNSSAPSTWVFYATHGDATISTSTGSTPVPEPGTLLLLAVGAAFLAWKAPRSEAKNA